MNSTPADAEVKPFSRLSELKAKLKGIGGNRRYGRFTRAQIEELKLALAPHYLTLCRRLFPYGVLSRREDYWHIPALDISINLGTGDFFALPFDLRAMRRLGDIISLYGLVYNLPFRQAMAALRRIANDVSGIPLTSGSKENGREKKRIVHAAMFEKSGERESGALSGLAIRRRVLAYLVSHPERYPKVKEEHPEFFFDAAFARLLREWSVEPPEEVEFFRLSKRSRGRRTSVSFYKM